jgi:predicted DNA-binding protein
MVDVGGEPYDPDMRHFSTGKTIPSASPTEVIPGYTRSMKTAISVPDATFERVERRVAELGINRSQFFARAAERYLDELEQRSVTERLNAAIALDAGRSDSETADFVGFSRRRLESATADDAW